MSLVTIASILFASLFIIPLASAASLQQDIPEECQPERLIQRLQNYLTSDEPLAFQIVLEQECRPYINFNTNPGLYKLMDQILSSSLPEESRFMMLNGFMRFGCTKVFHRTLYKSSYLQPVRILKMLKRHNCKPNTFYLNSIARKYPSNSPERSFLVEWMFSDVQQTLPQWPFRKSFSTAFLSLRHPMVNLKLRFSQSYNHQVLRKRAMSFWTQRRNSPKTSSQSSIESHNIEQPAPLLLTYDEPLGLDLDELECTHPSPQKPNLPIKLTSPPKPTPTEPVVDTLSIASTASVPSSSKGPVFNFGYLMGAASMDAEPTMIIKNNKTPFRIQNHLALLDDSFLMFLDDQYRFNDILSKLNKLKTLNIAHGSALAQKIKARNANFGYARLLKGTNQLQALLYKDIRLVVLSPNEETQDYYIFKYPQDPYENLKQSSEELESISVPVAENDIVLLLNRNSFLPRTLERAPSEDPNEPAEIAQGLRPHDLAGIFYFADLTNFDQLFRLLLKHTHSRTKAHGLLLVGGYIFNNRIVKK